MFLEPSNTSKMGGVMDLQNTSKMGYSLSNHCTPLSNYCRGFWGYFGDQKCFILGGIWRGSGGIWGPRGVPGSDLGSPGRNSRARTWPDLGGIRKALQKGFFLSRIGELLNTLRNCQFWAIRTPDFPGRPEMVPETSKSRVFDDSQELPNTSKIQGF